ncbi:MAG: TraE/TraK family type IV conjugative transfer system protein [Thermofilaceae archaeon]
MTGEKFISSYRDALAKYGIVKFILVFLVVIQVLQVIALFYAISHQTVVIVPTSEINKRFQVRGSTADLVYVEHMVRHFINLINNYSPETVSQNFEEVMYYIHPSDQAEFRKFLVPEERAVKSTGVSRVFYILKMEHLLNENAVRVHGIERRIVGDKVTYSGPKTYKVVYFLDNGRFYVKAMVEEASGGSRQVDLEGIRKREEERIIERPLEEQ